jgi:hypothetical protein
LDEACSVGLSNDIEIDEQALSAFTRAAPAARDGTEAIPMATKTKRASAEREIREEPRDMARTTPVSAPPKKRGAVVALRVASAGGHDAPPAHPEPRATRATRATPPTPPAPRRPTSARKQFTELRDALAGGWEIVQPVFARPLWSSADDSLTAFSFVLRRDAATRLVTVPGGRLVEKFIAARQLKVDERR